VRIEYQDIVEVIAKPACKNIDFIIVDSGRVTPSGDVGKVFGFPLSPDQLPGRASGKQRGQIKGVDVTEAAILGVTASNNEHLITNQAG
jgi:hypothetical protein